jgi:hypothetical protein
MSKRPKIQPADDDNPEWTAQEAAAAKRFADLPATLQGTSDGACGAAGFGALAGQWPGLANALGSAVGAHGAVKVT